MSGPTLRGHWLTPDRGRDLLVVGPSLGTGVVALWGQCAEALGQRADVDVLGWDLPGHGDGEPFHGELTLEDLASAVVALVDRERPSAGFAYAGVSVGGVTGLALASGRALAGRGQDPARVRGSAVICSGAKVGTPEAWHERAETVRRAGTPSMVEGSTQRWFAPGFLERDPATATGLLTTLQHTDKESYARVCEALAGADLREEVRSISVPVLVMGGRHDVVCTPEQQAALAASIEGSTLVIVEDAAHLAPAEAPLEVAEVLDDWLGTLR